MTLCTTCQAPADCCTSCLKRFIAQMVHENNDLRLKNIVLSSYLDECQKNLKLQGLEHSAAFLQTFLTRGA